jgi:hypothetical protein
LCHIFKYRRKEGAAGQRREGDKGRKVVRERKKACDDENQKEFSVEFQRYVYITPKIMINGKIIVISISWIPRRHCISRVKGKKSYVKANKWLA